MGLTSEQAKEAAKKRSKDFYREMGRLGNLARTPESRRLGGVKAAKTRGFESLSSAGKKAVNARTHESRVAGGKKAALTRGREAMREMARKGRAKQLQPNIAENRSWTVRGKLPEDHESSEG